MLDGAVGALFDVRRGEVGELLVDVRAALEQQGRELVLLVEDLALLQGVEQELLEAIIAPKQEVDGRPLCAVRAAFAATPGHFERMPTVRSRLDADNGFLYSLDASSATTMSRPSASLTDALKLVGSYLNAARWGKDAIEDWAHENPDLTGAPPNRCEDCELAKSCLKGFGASPELGHGLYPFNATAIRRMLIGESIRYFEPRLVLKHVRDTLRDEREALIRGKFPTDRWANLHNPSLTPIANKVESALQDAHRSPDTARRAEHLLMFWAGETEQVVNLPRTSMTRFNPPVPGAPTVHPDADLDASAASRPTAQPAPRQREQPSRGVGTPASHLTSRNSRTIAEWRTALRSGTPQKRSCRQAMARDLRQAFAGFLLDGVPAALEFLSYDKQKTVSDLAERDLHRGRGGRKSAHRRGHGASPRCRERATVHRTARPRPQGRDRRAGRSKHSSMPLTHMRTARGSGSTRPSPIVPIQSAAAALWPTSVRSYPGPSRTRTERSKATARQSRDAGGPRQRTASRRAPAAARVAGRWSRRTGSSRATFCLGR